MLILFFFFKDKSLRPNAILTYRKNVDSSEYRVFAKTYCQDDKTSNFARMSSLG